MKTKIIKHHKLYTGGIMIQGNKVPLNLSAHHTVEAVQLIYYLMTGQP